MKTHSQNLFITMALVAGFGLIPTGRVTAQTFTTVYAFSGVVSNFYNTDGAWPLDGLVLSGNTLYGTAEYGGLNGIGTVFKVNTDGTGFGVLHTFVDPVDAGDGGNPAGGLCLSGNTLYGTASWGNYDWNTSVQYSGTVYSLTTNGTGFTTLYAPGFDRPDAALILSGNTLYGTTFAGGLVDNASNQHWGMVFAVNTGGGGGPIYSFSTPDPVYLTNNDGVNLYCRLVLSGNTLYGLASGGGNYGFGTIFSVHTDGTGFTNLHNFNGVDGDYPIYGSGLTLSGNVLYGATPYGGLGWGTVFRINTDGTGFTNLYNFTNGRDGGVPECTLLLSGNVLYGTTTQSGSGSGGTLFQINTNGTGFSTLYSFNESTDGLAPMGSLILSANFIYGITHGSGPGGPPPANPSGTVFKFSLPTTGMSNPNLSVLNFINGHFSLQLTGWTGTNYIIQMSTNLAANIWNPVFTNTATNGTFSFTDTSATNESRFYRAVQQ